MIPWDALPGHEIRQIPHPSCIHRAMCTKDSFLLVDPHGWIEHPPFLEEDVTLILPRAVKSNLGQPGHPLAFTLTPRDPGSPTGPSGPLAPWKKTKERQK